MALNEIEFKFLLEALNKVADALERIAFILENKYPKFARDYKEEF